MLYEVITHQVTDGLVETVADIKCFKYRQRTDESCKTGQGNESKEEQ